MIDRDEMEQFIGWALLAAFGGAVKYISAVLRTNTLVSNRRFVMLLIANVFISSFCGLMGGLLLTTLTDNITWQYLSCGIFGYLGTQGLDIIVLILKKKIEPPMPVSAIIPVPSGSDPASQVHE